MKVIAEKIVKKKWDTFLSNLFIEEGNGNPLQYSCLGNPMDRGAWWAIESDINEWLNSNSLFRKMVNCLKKMTSDYENTWLRRDQVKPSLLFSLLLLFILLNLNFA